MQAICFNYTMLLFACLTLIPLSGKTQPDVYDPGPANADKSSFAHIYFIRTDRDVFPDHWFGLIMNDDSGLCVKISPNSIHCVHTKRKGPTRFISSIYGVNEELMLNLEANKNYFVGLNPEKRGEQNIRLNMTLLEDTTGLRQTKAFSGKIQERYCILPYGNHDYRENVWKDTVSWYAAKNHLYQFMPLPSWEVILRSVARTVMGFRNNLISATYSEVGGIQYHPLKKCNSETEFENYCRNDFLKTTLNRSTDSLIRMSIKPIAMPEGMLYARWIYTETAVVKQTSDYAPLRIHSAYAFFFWKDAKGKGNAACLYTSERGLPEELHPEQVLEDRILWSWKSFQLVSKNK